MDPSEVIGKYARINLNTSPRPRGEADWPASEEAWVFVTTYDVKCLRFRGVLRTDPVHVYEKSFGSRLDFGAASILEVRASCDCTDP